MSNGFNQQLRDIEKKVSKKTNVVTAVEVDEKYAGDAKFFPPIVDATAENSQIAEVSADGAYCGDKNTEVVDKVGATPSSWPNDAAARHSYQALRRENVPFFFWFSLMLDRARNWATS